MTKSLFKSSSRTRIFTVITSVGIVLLLLLNLLFTYLGLEGQLFIDTTPEGFHSFSPNMASSLSELLVVEDEGGKRDVEIEIIFCNDPDALVSSYVTRPTYFMALQMRNKFKGVKVSTVNVNVNPAALAQFQTTSHRDINPNDMIITYQGRYKIINISDFWTKNNFSYNGEYRMVSLIASLTAQNAPAAYFLTGHGESYYDPTDPDSETSRKFAALAELIEERGLNIKLLDLSAVDKIPDDCAMLIINDPRVDFIADADKLNQFGYVSDLEKIDRYMLSRSGGLIINKDHEISLPNLEDYLKEWLIGYGEGIVKDVDNSIESWGDDGSTVVGQYKSEGVANEYYSAYASLYSAPKMIFPNTGYVYCSHIDTVVVESGGYDTIRTYVDFIDTSEKSKVYDSFNQGNLIGNEAKRSLAALSVRQATDSHTSEAQYSYVFATATKDFLTADVLGNSTYANYTVMASVIDSISRVDRYASIELGGLSLNSPSYGGKQTYSTTLPTETTKVYSSDAENVISVNYAFTTVYKVIFTVLVGLVPLAIGVLGVIIHIKRKHL